MHGLYLLWWVQEKEMPAPVVAATLAAGDLAVTLFEVPTAWFADRFGHRASLVLGSFVQVAGMLACWLGAGVPGLVAASVLVALGDAFRSGADQALLYRTCAALRREPDFQRIEARTRSAQLVALVVLTLTGGAIVTRWGFAAGWLAEASLCAAGLLIACAMTEPPGRKEAPASHEVAAPPCVPRDAARAIARLAALVLPMAFVASASSAALFVVQTAHGSDPGEMTVLVAVVTLAEAAGSLLASRLPAGGAATQAALAAFGAALLAVGISHAGALVPAIVVLEFLVGVSYPLRAAALQRHTADHLRARAASMASACDMALSSIGLVWAGHWRRRSARL